MPQGQLDLLTGRFVSAGSCYEVGPCNPIAPRGLCVGKIRVLLGALKTQVQHFVGENVAWEKVTTT